MATAVEHNGAQTETLEALVKGRVPKAQYDAVLKLVRQRRQSGALVSQADILREALTEYFAKRKIKVAA